MASSDHRAIKSRSSFLAMTAALLAAALMATPVAQAQAPAASPAAPGVAPPAATNFSDQKIGAAAAAMEQVSSLRQNYQQQLAAAPPDQQQQIADQATAALQKAVTDQGLSVDEYNGILSAAQQDASLRQKLVARMHPPGTQN